MSPIRVSGHLALAGIAALLLTGAAFGQAQVPFSALAVDRGAPVEIEAAALEVDQQGGAAEFSGDVLVVQDGLRLSAERLWVSYGDDPTTGQTRIREMRAIGSVTLVTPSEAAEAGQAVYDLDAGQLTLEGDVLLTQGGNALAGDRLVIDLGTGTGRMEGRVRSVILPGSRP
ncbi:MAG: LptA/OstA family protein [Alkalilacustris sp.]